MVRIGKNITVNCPVETIWQYLTDLEKMPKRERDAIEAKQVSPGLVGRGTTVRIFDSFIGQRPPQLQITD